MNQPKPRRERLIGALGDPVSLILCTGPRHTWLVLSVLFVLGGYPIRSMALDASTYLLDTGDKLRISVLHRPEFNGEYEVRASGEISFPLVGRVTARGLSLTEIERSIEQALSARPMGTVFVNIEIIEHRPFYIDGDVVTPGAYPYQFGLNVNRAIALAGGRYSERSDTTVSAIEESRERENAERLVQSYWADAAREARLLAERRGMDDVAFPNDFLQERSDTRIKELIDNEERLFETRRELLVDHVALLEKQVAAYDKTVAGLLDHEQEILRKRRLVLEQLDDFGSLFSEGLAPRRDVLIFEINVIEIERELLELKLAILETGQRKLQVEQKITNLRNQRETELAKEYLDVQERLSKTAIGIEASSQRLAWMVSPPLDSIEATPIIIRRRNERGHDDIVAKPDTPILPGDELRIPFPGDSDSRGIEIRLPTRISQQ